MANVRNGNTWFLDSSGQLDESNTKVAYILFTPGAANDVLRLSDSSGGSDKIELKLDSASSQLFDFSSNPLVFPNGIYVTQLTAGAKASLVVIGG